MLLVGFIIRICHDARSPERQIHLGDITRIEYLRTVHYGITCEGGLGINSATADRYLQETTKCPARYTYYQLHL